MTEGSLYRNRCLRGTESIHSGYKASLFGHSPEMSSGSPGWPNPAQKKRESKIDRTQVLGIADLLTPTEVYISDRWS